MVTAVAASTSVARAIPDNRQRAGYAGAIIGTIIASGDTSAARPTVMPTTDIACRDRRLQRRGRDPVLRNEIVTGGDGGDHEIVEQDRQRNHRRDEPDDKRVQHLQHEDTADRRQQPRDPDDRARAGFGSACHGDEDSGCDQQAADAGQLGEDSGGFAAGRHPAGEQDIPGEHQERDEQRERREAGQLTKRTDDGGIRSSIEQDNPRRSLRYRSAGTKSPDRDDAPRPSLAPMYAFGVISSMPRPTVLTLPNLVSSSRVALAMGFVASDAVPMRWR